jgi:hypothetical protein
LYFGFFTFIRPAAKAGARPARQALIAIRRFRRTLRFLAIFAMKTSEVASTKKTTTAARRSSPGGRCILPFAFPRYQRNFRPNC